MNIGRIRKIILILKSIENEEYRKHILTQPTKSELHYVEKREIYNHSKESQENQLNSLHFMINAIVVKNILYMQTRIKQREGNGKIIENTDLAKFHFNEQTH